MVHFSEKFVKDMKSFRITDDDVDGLIKSLYERGDCDRNAFTGIWTRLKDRYFGMKDIMERSGVSYPDGLSEDVRTICATLEKIGLDSRGWPENPSGMKPYDEERLTIYFTTLALNTNKIYRDYPRYVKTLSPSGNVMAKMRNSPGFLKKFLMTLGLAAAMQSTPMQSGTIGINKDMEKKAAIELYSKTHVDIQGLGTIKIPEGYELYTVVDSALVTNYTPTGRGLMAGKNRDGTHYAETGKTSTGNDALRDFTGAATADTIPKGAIMYIEGVGWKIADDTGGELRKNAKKGIVHIDVRTDNYKKAMMWGRQHRKAYIFVKSKYPQDVSSYNKVLEARDMHKQGMDTFFRRF